MPGPAIHVENLSLRLGASQILDQLSFSVAAGSIHCLIGPNGGGKTSTLRCLLGQMPHTGNIRYEWHGAQRSIGYVPQLIELERTLPLTITDFLTIVSQNSPAFNGMKKQVKPAIEAALSRAGLFDKRKYMIGSLSGGERQRLLFAQALIPEPALLVLDEPMTSLDEGGSRLFEQLIRDIHASGTTVLWINHDLDQVARVAQDLTVIERRVLASGPVATTLSDDMKRGVFARAAGEAA
ncbi:MAG: metal ABC transporter ATP-binding protein [Pseudohongiellaceae bacterium]|jgi:zinc transport system ATP-binding protein